MASSPSDNFAKMFLPDHPHRRLHVLLSILAFAVVFGSITLYQINKSGRPPKAEITPPESDNNKMGLSQEQRNQIIVNLQESASKSPPLTDEQRTAVMENLKKSISDNN